MQGRHAQNTATLAILAFGVFEIAHLRHYRNRLNKEDSAHERQEQLLTDAERKDRYDTSAMIPPMASEPVSPMKIWAGNELYHKNPSNAPPIAAAKTTSSAESGIYIILR